MVLTRPAVVGVAATDALCLVALTATGLVGAAAGVGVVSATTEAAVGVGAGAPGAELLTAGVWTASAGAEVVTQSAAVAAGVALWTTGTVVAALAVQLAGVAAAPTAGWAAWPPSLAAAAPFLVVGAVGVGSGGWVLGGALWGAAVTAVRRVTRAPSGAHRRGVVGAAEATAGGSAPPHFGVSWHRGPLLLAAAAAVVAPLRVWMLDARIRGLLLMPFWWPLTVYVYAGVVGATLTARAAAGAAAAALGRLRGGRQATTAVSKLVHWLGVGGSLVTAAVLATAAVAGSILPAAALVHPTARAIEKIPVVPYVGVAAYAAIVAVGVGGGALREAAASAAAAAAAAATADAAADEAQRGPGGSSRRSGMRYALGGVGCLVGGGLPLVLAAVNGAPVAAFLVDWSAPAAARKDRAPELLVPLLMALVGARLHAAAWGGMAGASTGSGGAFEARRADGWMTDRAPAALAGGVLLCAWGKSGLSDLLSFWEHSKVSGATYAAVAPPLCAIAYVCAVGVWLLFAGFREAADPTGALPNARRVMRARGWGWARAVASMVAGVALLGVGGVVAVFRKARVIHGPGRPTLDSQLMWPLIMVLALLMLVGVHLVVLSLSALATAAISVAARAFRRRAPPPATAQSPTGWVANLWALLRRGLAIGALTAGAQVRLDAALDPQTAGGTRAFSAALYGVALALVLRVEAPALFESEAALCGGPRLWTSLPLVGRPPAAADRPLRLPRRVGAVGAAVIAGALWVTAAPPAGVLQRQEAVLNTAASAAEGYLRLVAVAAVVEGVGRAVTHVSRALWRAAFPPPPL